MSNQNLRPAAEECPRATRFLKSLTKEMMLRWVLEYNSGRPGLVALETSLTGARHA